ncbi:MAG: deoxyribonuclease IV [Actinomycetota bacterium]
MRIGAHVRTPGGLRTAVESARAVGAEAAQLFISNPRAWSGPRPETAEKFGQEWREGGIGPLFVHAPYLVNIASPNPDFVVKSLELCRKSVVACGIAGADGFVVHAGSGGPGAQRHAVERAAATLRLILDETEGTNLIVELMAATAGAVASTWPEAARLFELVDDARLRLCGDTCHLFVAGYALDEPEGVDACFGELRTSGLADRLALIHANDAKFPRGSKRDRHENIGDGEIGLEGFRAVLRQPEVADLSVIVETPHGGELHRRDVERLRALAP